MGGVFIPMGRTPPCPRIRPCEGVLRNAEGTQEVVARGEAGAVGEARSIWFVKLSYSSSIR